MKYELVADDEAMTRWKDAARKRGQSFAEFLRDAAERSASAAAPPPPAAPRPKGECPRARFHRSAAYCKTCGVTQT